jgi:molybdate transport system permease protein
VDPEELRALWFTVACALAGVGLVALPAFGLAWLLARRDWPGKSLLETAVALPLVLPPVATGLILLKLLGRRGWLGGWAHAAFGWDIAFTWRAVPVALGAAALPLMVRSFRVALEGVDPRLEQVARTLGGGELRVLRTITLPLAQRGLLAGLVLGFARALGEFGATVVLAGNIPGETSTLALALYRAVELGRDDQALRLLLVSIVLAYGALWMSERALGSGRRP